MIDWPHSPVHRTLKSGTYMVTCGTYLKEHYFREPLRLHLLHNTLIELAKAYHWELQSWAVFSNHYHFIGKSPKEGGENLSSFISQLHSTTAKYVNQLDNERGRKVWHEYWDSLLTYQYSYLARLNYVNQNPVRHGLVRLATMYPWCSAHWFEVNTPTAFRKTVESFKIDKVNVPDDF